MAEKKVYIGTEGPYLYDDADLVSDADGDFTGLYYSGITAHQVQADQVPIEDKEVLRISDSELDTGSLAVEIDDKEMEALFLSLIPEPEVQGLSTVTSYFVVWAECSGALGTSNSYDWSFGDSGSLGSGDGFPLLVFSGSTVTLVAMSLNVAAGSATVEAVVNGTPQGSSANIAVTGGGNGTQGGMSVSINLGNTINFRTTTSSGTSGPCHVSAWFKVEV